MATAERLAGGTPIAVDFERGVPHATYCTPEIASVGLTEAQAKEQGYDVKVTKHAFAGNARAQMMHAARGFAKLVSRRRRRDPRDAPHRPPRDGDARRVAARPSAGRRRRTKWRRSSIRTRRCPR